MRSPGRLLLAAGLLLAGCMNQSPPHAVGDDRPPAEARRLFISPMGEPFRATPGGKPPEEIWFEGVDTNHDGALSLVEFSVDAARFFATLDVDHNGEIDPGEIDRYERVVAPEVRTGGAAWHGARRRGGFGGRDGGDGGRASFGEAMPLTGAGRYGYLAIPEPVAAADTNLDRTVSREEFLAAAARRFALLDANGDGLIRRNELPRLPAPPRHRRHQR